ncbi:MAG: YggS family pyridoxal phosphate-dependent enzyme [Proteobacteria bacterium]|nr:YggS family pyridoxal phosphate-dependent enzyme [Rhodobacterales bacterium LSUCC0374]MDA0900793.1 YggS family pyridoxal phosphate-dependent enzyme [Pseudomonadota bacterium]NBX42831.1 YggS family pyridoxal phosphate-dependent enzyme [Paracoccaceae bacterium]
MMLDDIQADVARILAEAGRAPDAAKLLAVSKVQPNARVEAVLQAGHRSFGENRVQEAQGKWPDFKAQFEGVDLHLIGPLQSNKVRQAMDLFDAIHTVDREKLARRIADMAQELGHCPDLFIQVNTGAEPQKAGILPAEADAFVKTVRAMDLPLKGLMCIPPVDEEPSLHFALLDKIAARNGLSGLSMGMSADYEIALRLGATHIRVGSAIFGERITPHR